jgi:hypothetical protein
MGPWSVNAPYVSGWALDARSAFGCMAGSWCPYACKSPYFETQYDNAVGQVRGIHLSPVSCRLLLVRRYKFLLLVTLTRSAAVAV